jgi:hypothetical protein
LSGGRSVIGLRLVGVDATPVWCCRGRFVRTMECVAIGLALGLAGAGAAVASGWRLQVVQRSASGSLLGVSCTSSAACIAVGAYGARASVALAERWDGSRWSLLRAPMPLGAKNGGLEAVSCSSPSVCTAVGSVAMKGGNTATLAERWNGSRWSIQRTPNQVGVPGSQLNGVSCASRRSCTAVGMDGDPNSGTPFMLVERWDGSRWSIQPTPSAGGLDGALGDVSCPSVTMCTAVGATAGDYVRVERWNGIAWSIQPTPDVNVNGSSFFSGVSCASASACVAVGAEGDSAGSFSVAEGWNGSRWSDQNAPFLDGDQLNSVSCTSARVCTAVGSAGGGGPLAERWNGRHWSVQGTAAGVPGGSLSSISCTSKVVCVAVGNVEDASGNHLRPLVERRS